MIYVTKYLNTVLDLEGEDPERMLRALISNFKLIQHIA